MAALRPRPVRHAQTHRFIRSAKCSGLEAADVLPGATFASEFIPTGGPLLGDNRREFVPSLVGQLLLGEQLTGVGLPVARVTGIALIALGIACWPGPPVEGMLTYSPLVTVYLVYLALPV